VRLAAAEATLTRVLSLTPKHAMAHCLLGFVQINTNRAIQGIAECEKALELDRNLAHAHGFIGLAKCFSGRAEETEAHVQEASRLSPRDDKTSDWMGMIGVAKSYLGDDDAAVGSFRRSIEANRNAPHSCISFWPLPWLIRVGLMKRGPRYKPGLLSIRLSPSRASAPV
jgi:tetratricopeptide (TPR) repeat protein